MSRSAPLAVDLSVDEFMAYDTPDGKAELVRGELRMTPSPGGGHGVIVTALITRLGAYVDGRKLGRIFSNTGFELLESSRQARPAHTVPRSSTIIACPAFPWSG